MRAIVNGKLYDTEKAEHICYLYHSDTGYNVYKTQKGNIFAVNVLSDIFIDGEQLKRELSGSPYRTDDYIRIFGIPEEA